MRKRSESAANTRQMQVNWKVCLGGYKKMLGCGSLGGIIIQVDTMPNLTILTSLKSKNFLCHPCSQHSIYFQKRFLALLWNYWP